MEEAMGLIYAVAALASAVAAVLAWVAKLKWAKEYSVAKDEVIKAKEAQILVLKEQLQNLRELTPMKLREYFLSVKQQLEEFASKLQSDLKKANEDISERQKEIENLKTHGSAQGDKIKKLELEKNKLQTAVSKLESEVKRAPILQGPITPATISSYMLETNADLGHIGGSWKELAELMASDSRDNFIRSYFIDPVWGKSDVHKSTEKEGPDDGGCED